MNHNNSKTDSITEGELISGLLRGDEKTYSNAYKTYRESMFYYAKSIAGEDNAEEIIQETWIIVLKALPKFERRSSLKTWIIAVVKNTAKNYLRKEKRIFKNNCKNIEELTEYSMNGENLSLNLYTPKSNSLWHMNTPDAIIARDELNTVIKKVVDKLPGLQKKVLNLRCAEGLNTQETSQHLKQSSSNIRVNLHRARVAIDEKVFRYQMGA